MSIVTIKGQATIPKPVRDFLGVVPGKTNIDFVIVNNRVEVVKKDDYNPFEQVRGITRGKMTTEEIMELTRGEG